MHDDDTDAAHAATMVVVVLDFIVGGSRCALCEMIWSMIVMNHQSLSSPS